MTKREKIQNGCFRGGEIGGIKLYPMCVDRVDLLNEMSSAPEGSRKMDATRVALQIYAMSPEEARRMWTWEELLEAGQKFGGMLVDDVREFEAIFTADMAAMNASAAKREEAVSDNDGGKT